MLQSLRNHPYLIAGCIVFDLVFLTGFFALDFSWSKSLLLAGVISVVIVGGAWWKEAN